MPEADKDKLRSRSNNEYLKYSGLAFKLAGTAAIWMVLGHYLDVYLKLKFPIALLVGAAMAVISVFYILFKELK